MLIDPYLRTRLLELHIRQQMDAAARDRVLREGRPRRAWRVSAIRLAARSLRVERELEREFVVRRHANSGSTSRA